MRKSSYVKIGAFVCAAVTLAIVAVLLMGSGSMRKRELLFETYVEETVQGVSEGSAVKYRGIPVGIVKSVSFAMADYQAEDVVPGAAEDDVERASRYARVVFAVDATDMADPESFMKLVERQIAYGLRAHMKSQGITGLVYIDLDYEDPGRPTLPVPWNPKYRYIPSAPSLVKTLSDVAQNIVQELHGFADLKADTSNLIARITMLVDNANNAVLSVDDSIAGLPALLGSVSNAVAGASSFLQSAEGDIAPLPDLLMAASNLVTDASAFLASVKGDVTDIAASSTNFLAGADGAVAGIRPPLENTLEDISRAARNLADILDAIRNDPGRLFQKTAEEDMP